MTYNNERKAVANEVKNFHNALKPIYNLCSSYINEYCIQFSSKVENYRLNYHSHEDYANTFESFRLFGRGTAQLLNRLFKVYNPEQQDAVFENKRHIFLILNAAVRIMQSVVELGYAVSKDLKMRSFGDLSNTCIGNGIAEAQCKRRVKLKSNVHVTEAQHNVLLNRLKNRKCRLIPYAETGYLESLMQWCVKNRNNNTLTSYCQLTADFIKAKELVFSKQNENLLQLADLDNILTIWSNFREEHLKLILQNYITLSDFSLISCLEKFLEEQHELMLDLTKRRSQLQTILEEGTLEAIKL